MLKEEMEKDTARQVFAAFSEHNNTWSGAVEAMAELDCLISLALVSSHHSGCVRPSFVSFEANGGHALLDLRQGVHPTLYESSNVNGLKTGTDHAFIANDVLIGVPNEQPARFVLVTGPNMGQFSLGAAAVSVCAVMRRSRNSPLACLLACLLACFAHAAQVASRLCFARRARR